MNLRILKFLSVNVLKMEMNRKLIMIVGCVRDVVMLLGLWIMVLIWMGLICYSVYRKLFGLWNVFLEGGWIYIVVF